MTENMTSALASQNMAPPVYVSQYGMSRDPFDNRIDDELFYAEPSRKQKLDILLHLTQYGNELVLLTGPTGSGKTTLLQQYLLRALDTWSVARIEAKEGIDERKLIQQLFHQMGMDFHGATHTELFERMEHHFDSLHHGARQAVMLVDDADKLPVTALNRILEMASLTSRDNKPLLRVILFGTKQLEENFNDPLIGPFLHIVRRSVELPAFNEEHTTHYILHRLSAAHFSADKPFTDTALHKIYRRANGWPGEINRLAHDLLIETLPSPGDTPGLGSPSATRVLRAVAAVVVISLISALLIFQDEFNAWLDHKGTQTASLTQPPHTNAAHSQPVTTDDASPASSAPAEATLATLADSAHTDLTPGTTETTETTETTDSSLAKPTTPALPTVNTPVAGTLSENSAELETSPTEAVPANPPEAPAPQANKPDTTPTPARPIAVPLPAIPDDLPGYREPWIAKQNPSYYTLQLVAGKNISTLRDFINEHTLTAPLAIYRSTRKHKPWFGLIYHVYPTKQAAIDARGKLPKPLRQPTPWVRQMGALQKELNAAHSP